VNLRPRTFCAWLALASVAAAASACSDSSLTIYCTGIPEGGCPGDPAEDFCDQDSTCASIYTCEQGNTWTFVTKCPGYSPPKDAGADGSRDATLDAHASADAHARDVGFSLPEGAAGGPGCPDLDDTDCPVETAVACGVGCCGCVDLWVCVDGGWNAWGECGEAGTIEQNER
jgi:hypothetical protein